MEITLLICTCVLCKLWTGVCGSVAGFCLDGVRLDLANEKRLSNLFYYPLLMLSQMNSESVEVRLCGSLFPLCVVV